MQQQLYQVKNVGKKVGKEIEPTRDRDRRTDFQLAPLETVHSNLSPLFSHFFPGEMDSSSPPTADTSVRPPNENIDDKLPSKVPPSCTKAFDSLYYCYSPFFQGRQYYMNGELDNCRGRLRRFRLCLMSRLKPQSEAEELFVREEQRIIRQKNLDNVQPIWQMREEYLDNVARAQQHSEGNQSEKESTSWWL